MNIRFGLCAALAISLCGCFEVTEDVEVHENGQGTHRIEQRLFDVAELIGEEELEDLKAEIAAAVEELKEHPEVVSAEGDAEVKDADLFVHMAYTVKDFKSLAQVAAEARGQAMEIAENHDLGGAFRFEELDSGTWRWTYPMIDEGQLAASTKRRHAARRTKQAVAAGKSADEIKTLNEEEYRIPSINYRFRAPQVLEAEGAELDGSEARWSYPLDAEDELDLPEALSAEFTLSAPFPWGFALIGGGLSFGLVGGLWLRKKWAKRWE